LAVYEVELLGPGFRSFVSTKIPDVHRIGGWTGSAKIEYEQGAAEYFRTKARSESRVERTACEILLTLLLMKYGAKDKKRKMK
jgi:hypothetical protein